MTSHRDHPAAPLWMNDARIRRMIADSVRRRRAKRKRELADFERQVQRAQDAENANSHGREVVHMASASFALQKALFSKLTGGCRHAGALGGAARLRRSAIAR